MTLLVTTPSAVQIITSLLLLKLAVVVIALSLLDRRAYSRNGMTKIHCGFAYACMAASHIHVSKTLSGCAVLPHY